MKNLLYSLLTLALGLVLSGAGCDISEEELFPPDAPINLAATPGDSRVSLSWNAPDSDGGSPILNYEVQTDDGAYVTADSHTAHTVTGLINGTQYIFRVRAVNAAGKGAYDAVKAIPVKPGGNQAGGLAPYDKAKDFLLEQFFKELSIELVTKRYHNNVLTETEHRIVDAKGGSFHMYSYSVESQFSTERYGESDGIFIKAGNGYYAWNLNLITRKYDGDPVYSDDAETVVEGIIYFLAKAWGLIPVLSEFRDIEFAEGSKSVAGRECEKYVSKYNIPTFPETIFWVDKQNGCLLEHTKHLVDDLAYTEEYECTIFKTSGVTLPSHP